MVSFAVIEFLWNNVEPGCQDNDEVLYPPPRYNRPVPETRIPISRDRKFTASEKSLEAISKYEIASYFQCLFRLLSRTESNYHKPIKP